MSTWCDWDDPELDEDDHFEEEYTEADAIEDEATEMIKAAEAAMRVRPNGLPEDMQDLDDWIYS